ncbi:hypothetical protein SUGI_1195090 [Cryptomeria japonica]|nr:hypothetical protein SUGI_1195090 [Cryptomeria japonica]
MSAMQGVCLSSFVVLTVACILILFQVMAPAILYSRVALLIMLLLGGVVVEAKTRPMPNGGAILMGMEVEDLSFEEQQQLIDLINTPIKIDSATRRLLAKDPYSTY